MNTENILENVLLNTDSYKTTHWKIYNPKMGNIFSYIESRGGEYPEHVFFGLQIFIKSFLSTKITKEMIEQANEFINLHIGPNIFNYNGFIKMLEKYDGYWPVIIKAVPEGSVIKNKNVLVTIESIDPEFNWVPSYLETALLRAVWMPTTVATISYNMKKVIKKYLEETSDSLNSLGFGVLNFGSRGVSSQESDQIASAAHLLSFSGSDSLQGVATLMKYYDAEMHGFSVMASEHSVMTSFRLEDEFQSLKYILESTPNGNIISIVADTWDCFKVARYLNHLNYLVKEKNLILVYRFDSGEPKQVIPEVIKILDKGYDYEFNSKGYKVYKNLKFLWGDGINPDNISEILDIFKNLQISTEMVMQGCGGGLLQNKVQRDSGGKWAMKASAMELDGKWIGIGKNPVTDPGKVGKKGRLMLYKNDLGEIYTAQKNKEIHNIEMLQIIYNKMPIISKFENIYKIQERLDTRSII